MASPDQAQFCLQWASGGELCTYPVKTTDPDWTFCPGCGVKFCDKESVNRIECPNLNEEDVLCRNILSQNDYADRDSCDQCGKAIPSDVWKQVPDWTIPQDDVTDPRSKICHQILADGMCGKQSISDTVPKFCRSKACNIKFADRKDVFEINCPFDKKGIVCGRALTKPSDGNVPFFCASCGSFIPRQIWRQAAPQGEKENVRTYDDPNRHRRINSSEEKLLNEILGNAGLEKFFPAKLGIQEVMQITDAVGTDGSDVETITSFYHQLITLDCTCRDTFGRNFHKFPDKVPTDEASIISVTDMFAELESSLSETITNTAESEETQIHPQDFFILAYLCADPSLRATFIKKAFLCRLALPIYYPTFNNDHFEMLLGPLRSIILEWKLKGNSPGEIDKHESDAVSAKCHFVVFARITRSERYRKSKIMNDILCETIHPTFFHWDCPNGTRKRLLTDGLVEGSWYIPSGRDSDLFSSLILFYNLRGNMLHNLDQFRLFSSTATSIVLFASVNDLENQGVLHEITSLLAQGIIVVLLIVTDLTGKGNANIAKLKQALLDAQSEGLLKKDNIRLLKIITSFENGINKNADKLKLDLRKEIFQSTKSPPEKSYELFVKSNERVYHDEANDLNRRSRELADSVLGHIKIDGGAHFINVSKMKAMLPLQGDLWKRWSVAQKKLNRPFAVTGQPVTAVVNELDRQMNELRKEQFNQCLNPAPLMSSFIDTISVRDPIGNVTMTFLEWMKCYLDGHSRTCLPAFNIHYNDLWSELNAAKGDIHTNNRQQIEALQNKVKLAEERFANASFGLEHLFREIGQMYEAVTETEYAGSSKLVKQIKALPKRIAQLANSGQAIELMDGDACNIPVRWVKAIFDELHILLKAKSVFIISVLGVQSSGKSTLLNTLFGLQFAVSAGRCTKGVYMQLVRVDKRADFPFDYVCVLDTEGLRAAELGLANCDRDNELATFVIGLGDLTIVNIKGENYSEMKDVIQIVVHAFLRLKLVTQQPRSCIFIHQNVSAANAQDKLQYVCQKLQDNLDEITVEAAEQENRNNVRTFNDVIKFNCLEDVFFFPDLWHGNPPMAHTSIGYHEQIAAIKQNIFNNKRSTNSKFWSFKEISTKISDLWKAILGDDFVFAFRNSLEVKAYNTLEQKYRALLIEAEKKFLVWVQTTADKAIKNCTNEGRINKCLIALASEILSIAESIKVESERLFTTYISENSNADLMMKWKENKILALKHEVDSRVTSYKIDVSNALHKQRVKLLQNVQNSPLMDDLTKEACRLAERLRDSSKVLDLQHEFDKFWTKKTSYLHQRIDSVITDESIKDDIEIQLRKTFSSQQNKSLLDALRATPINKRLGKSEKLIPVLKENNFVVRSKHDEPAPGGIINYFGKMYASYTRQEAKSATKELEIGMKPAYAMLESLGESVQFSTQLVDELLQKVLEPSWKTESLISKETKTISFDSDFIPRIAVHACRYAFPIFCRKQNKYESTEGYVAQVNVYQRTLWNLFQNVYNKVSDELTCADLVSDQLRQIIKHITRDLIPAKIQFEVFQMYATKQCLIREILTDLAKSGQKKGRKEYKDYIGYLNNPRLFAGKWLDAKASESITHKNNGKTKLATIASSYIPLMCKDINLRLDHVKQSTEANMTLGNWIDKFCEYKTDNLHAIPNDFNVEKTHKGKLFSVEAFDKHMREKVSALEKDLIKQYLHAGPLDHGISHAVYERATDQLWGCTENCPFCGEPCYDSDPTHAMTYPHKCMQHRPTGLGGVHERESDILTLTNCNFNVAGDRRFRFKDKDDPDPYDYYKNYKQYYPDWDIDPNPSSTSSVPFWCWVYATFNEQIADAHGCVKPEIPSEWTKITREKSIESLQVAYTN